MVPGGPATSKAASSPPQVQGTPRQVVVASKNKVKVHATRDALKHCFPALTFTVTEAESDSMVPAQPFGDEETLAGARNRLTNLRSSTATSGAGPRQCGSSLLVAIEGGVGLRPQDQRMECFAWVAVGCSGSDAVSTARSGSFLLPPALEQRVLRGMELGAADDEVFGRQASGAGSGTVGKLTHGVISRTLYYEHAVALALIPFMNAELYGPEYEW